MRSTATRVLAVVAAAACAAGLSACRQSRDSAPEISRGDDTAVAGPSTDAPPGGADSTGAVEARDIEPITFTDEVVGLTETCDQIITDFRAPSYQKGAEANTTVYREGYSGCVWVGCMGLVGRGVSESVARALCGGVGGERGPGPGPDSGALGGSFGPPPRVCPSVSA